MFHQVRDKFGPCPRNVVKILPVVFSQLFVFFAQITHLEASNTKLLKANMFEIKI